MALTLNNFVGFETGGLEEALAIGGAVDTYETFVHAGDYSGGAGLGGTIDIAMITGGTPNGGDDRIVGFAFQFRGDPPAAGVIFEARDDAGNLLWSLTLNANKTFTAKDANGDPIGTSAGFEDDFFYFFEVRWQHVDSGNFDLHINGNPEIASGTADMSAAGAISADTAYYRLTKAGADVGYFDDIYCYSGASGVGDFLGDAEVYKYQSTLASDTPDTGDVLDEGTWDKAGETPLAATATNPEYENTGAGSVDTDGANGSPEGPKNDARIDGDANIRGMKGISNMKRSGGGGTAHYILMGNDVDGTTRSADLDPTTAFVSYFFISELGSIVPTTAQYCSIGFEMTNAQDYECQEQWAMLLHVPSAAPPVGADEMMAAIGQQTGGGGGSGDIMAHSRKPPESIAY